MRTSTPAAVLAVAIAISVALPVSLAGIVALGCAAHADTSTGASADKVADGALSKCKPAPDYLIKKIKIHRQPYRMLVTCRYRPHEMPLLMMPASNELTPLNALLTEISKEFIDADSKVVVQVEPGGGAVTAAYGCPWESLFCGTLARLQAMPASSARDEQLLNFAISFEQHVTRDRLFQAEDNKSAQPNRKSGTNSGTTSASGTALPSIRALRIYNSLPSMRASLKGKVDFACFKTYEDALAADRAERNAEANELYSKAVDQALAQCQSKDKDVQAHLKYVFEYAGQETYEGYRDFLIRRKDTKAVKALDARVRGKCLAPGDSHSLPLYMRSDGLREREAEKIQNEKSQTEKSQESDTYYPWALKGLSGLQLYDNFPVWTFDRVNLKWDYRPEKVKVYDLIQVPSFKSNKSKPEGYKHLFSQPTGDFDLVPYFRQELPIIFFF